MKQSFQGTFFAFLCVSFAALLQSAAMAQGIGIAALLNPEGSRLFPQVLLFPRHAGKPDPRWKSFQWRYIDQAAGPAKYRLYFYEGEQWPARFTIPRLQGQVADLTRKFNGFAPNKQFSYILFTSLREFRQANVFFVQEGVQGITSTQEATMAIPYLGDAKAFDHVSTHEMAHQFQVQKINELSAKRGGEDPIAYMPLWFIEGMAEYYSLGGLDPESQTYLRDLALYPDKKRGSVMPKFIDEGGYGFASTYKAGQAKIDFIETHFGIGKAQALLEAGARTLGATITDFQTLLEKELGVPKKELEASWQSYVDLRFRGDPKRFRQTFDSFTEVENSGDRLDFYDVTADGRA